MNSGFIAADDAHAVVAAILRAEVGCHRDPYLYVPRRLRVGRQYAEALGHHAYDRCVLPFERDGLIYDAGVGSETAFPKTVTQDHYALAARTVFGFGERAALRRLDAERREEIRGDGRALHLLGLSDAVRLTLG